MAKVTVAIWLLLVLGLASSCGDGAEPEGRLLFNGGVCPIDGGPRCGVFVLDPDGKNLTQITDVIGLSPQWSPDGKRLAMVTYRRGRGDLDQRSELTVLNADGSGSRGVAVGVAWESAEYQPFAWSPDGSEIAFEAAPGASSGGQAYNLSVVDVHSGQIRELAGGVSARAPVWSPDGSRIAFEGLHPDDEVEERYGIGGVWPDIWVVDADGDNLRRLAHREFRDSGAAWSPDGTSIAWLGMDIGPGGRPSPPPLYVASVDGEEVRSLGSGGWPIWSPNGEKLAFVETRQEDGEAPYVQDLVVMNVQDGERRTVASGLQVNVSQPVWSPDGKRIAVLSEHEGEPLDPAQIYVVDVEGANLTRITDDDLAKVDLDWSRR